MKMGKGFKNGATKTGVVKLAGKAKGKNLVATSSNVKSLGGKSGK